MEAMYYNKLENQKVQCQEFDRWSPRKNTIEFQCWVPQQKNHDKNDVVVSVYVMTFIFLILIKPVKYPIKQ